MYGHPGYKVNFWWDRMDFLLVKVIACKVIPLVRLTFNGQNHGPYNRDALYLMQSTVRFGLSSVRRP